VTLNQGATADHSILRLDSSGLILVMSRLRKMIKLGTPLKAMPVTGYHELEDWVHDSGRVLLIGQAAHPLHVSMISRYFDVSIHTNVLSLQHGSLQGTSLSLEDGAVLAKLFSYLSAEDQITSFLYAFQDLRIPRCKKTSTSELGNVTFMTLPPGEHQAGRDSLLKAKDAAGLNVLTPDEDDESTINSERWAQVKEMFGYDAEDEAENWWVQWGLLAMRAKGFDFRADPAFNFVMNEVISDLSVK
jgi:hypothetical protein